MVATIVILGILEVETQWPVCLSGHESRSSLFYTACWTTGEAHVSLLDSAVAASALDLGRVKTFWLGRSDVGWIGSHGFRR